MGYYISALPNTGKAQALVDEYEGQLTTFREIVVSEMQKDPDVAVIVVVHNPTFEAAAFAYSAEEFYRFHDITDPRKKEYVLMDRKKAELLSGYKQ